MIKPGTQLQPQIILIKTANKIEKSGHLYRNEFETRLLLKINDRVKTFAYSVFKP